ADARRFGGARSSGMQRNMPARTAPDAVPAKPATPAPGQQANAGGAAAAGTAAAASKRSWMGPIAGLAAGLGLAALMSHLGMGEGFANIVMMALLAVGAFMLIRFVMRRMNAGAQTPTPAMAGAGNSSPAWPQPVPQPQPLPRQAATDAVAASVPAAAVAAAGVAVPASSTGVTRAFVPASFDSESFTRTAKLIFIRMQAANDAADLDDLRRFTTPELFASLRLDLQERGPAAQQTDVQRVDAEVLDVADDDGRQIVSVRFHGLIVEEKGSVANPFDEVWHLVRPLDETQPWAIAGIEQMA
ncbi:MAG: TIM44-like domain-containing protein, partial [Rubrivivax sp.]